MACSEEEHLRRIFGEDGIPPAAWRERLHDFKISKTNVYKSTSILSVQLETLKAPHPKFAQYIHGLNTFLLDPVESSIGFSARNGFLLTNCRGKETCTDSGWDLTA